MMLLTPEDHLKPVHSLRNHLHDRGQGYLDNVSDGESQSIYKHSIPLMSLTQQDDHIHFDKVKSGSLKGILLADKFFFTDLLR